MKKLCLVVVSVAALAAAAAEWKMPDQAKAPVRTHKMNAVKGEAPSLVPSGRWQLVWNDEFTGNALVWDDVGLNHDKNGLWPFPKREEPKFLHRYGYYECRCRLQRKKGWWSAFWMQAPGNGATLDPANCGVEQDIMESFTPGEIITHAYHMKGYGADYRGFNAYRMPGSVDCMKNPVWKLDTDEFHTFGLLWEEDGYTVFIDGRQSGEKVGSGKGEAVSQVPEFILISTECKMFRTNRGTGKQDPDLEAAFQAGDDFVVDYVRVFDRVDKPTPEAPDRKWANFHARDLAPVKGEKRIGGDIVVVREGKAMPIVYNAKSKNQRNGPAANFLADVIFEMTGVRPDVFAEYPDRTVDVSPAFYVGDDVSAFKRHEALVKAGLAEPLPTASVEDEEFVVVPRKGSYWFLGRGDHGVFDFCDRILGVRQYFLENDIGRFAPKTRGLRVPQIEWRDKPVFAMRANYPWWASQWGRYLRDSGGGPVSRYPNLHVHPAGNLNRETNFNFGVRSPDIFEINADGKRNAQLCWGNPKALEAYKEIVTAGIEKGTPTYGIVDRWAKTVTVSQLDQGVHCHCERCQKLYDHSKAPNGDASPCIWGYFVKNLSEWMADKFPDWHIVILPYHNTCGCPEGLTFPRFELTRLWTRWSLYNNDQSAFGEFRFEE